MDVAFFWEFLNKDIEEINIKNLSSIMLKYVNVRRDSAWCDSFSDMFGVHKSLCVFVLCDELESKLFFTSLLGYQENCGDDVSDKIDDIKQTMEAISVLEKVKLD